MTTGRKVLCFAMASAFVFTSLLIDSPARGAKAGADETLMRLVLRNAVPQGPQQGPGSPSLLADLCRTGDVWERVWATGGDFNRSVHAGRVDRAEVGPEAIRLDLSIAMRADGYVPGGRIKVAVDVERAEDRPDQGGDRFAGRYRGTFRGEQVEGMAEIYVLPPREHLKEGYEPVQPGEHPRLLFRKKDLPALKAKARTPFGKAAVAKMSTNAAGFAMQYALTGDESKAAEARRRVEEMMKDEDKGSKRVRSRWIPWRMEQAAIAYDLCYDVWPEEFRRRTRDYLLRWAENVYFNRGRFDSHMNWTYGTSHAATVMYAAGVATLAIWGEPGPEPARPVPPVVVAEEDGTIAPAEGYKPGKGVEVFAFTSGRMPRTWLYVGPFPSKGDHPAGVGGRGGVRPALGEEVTFDGVTRAWRRIEEGKGYISHPKLTGGRTQIELTGPSGVAVRTMSYYYTVLRNDRPRWVRLELGNRGVEAWLGGRRMLEGHVARLEPGLYPWLITGPIGDMKPWGKTFVEPRLVDLSEAEAAEAKKRVAEIYEEKLRDWRLDRAQWKRTGGCDVRTLKAEEIALHQMRLTFRQMLGRGGCLSGAGQMAAMDGPNKYACMYRNVRCTDVSPYRMAADYLPRTLFVYPYRPDRKVVGQEVSGEPGFRTSGYPENERDTAKENFAALFPLTREEWKPALLWGWHWHAGLERLDEEGFETILTAPGRGYAFSRPYGDFNTHPLYAFVNYPLDMEPQGPEGILPLTWEAPDFGFYGFRSSWEVSSDPFITQFFAATYAEGAGTFRLTGLGHVWSHGLGEPAGRRYGENVVQLVADRINLGGRGRVTYVKTGEDGSGSVSMRLDEVYMAPREDERGRLAKPYERYGRVFRPAAVEASGITGMRAMAVDYSGRSGAPCLLVLVDKVRGGSEKTWTWQLESATTGLGRIEQDPKDGTRVIFQGKSIPAPPRFQPFGCTSAPVEGDERVKVDDRGFTLTQGDANLRATFLAPARPDIRFEERAEYVRGYKYSLTRSSSKAVFATGGDEFFVVVTVQRGDPPEVRADRRGLGATVRVGRQTVRFDGGKVVFGG